MTNKALTRRLHPTTHEEEKKGWQQNSQRRRGRKRRALNQVQATTDPQRECQWDVSAGGLVGRVGRECRRSCQSGSAVSATQGRLCLSLRVGCVCHSGSAVAPSKILRDRRVFSRDRLCMEMVFQAPWVWGLRGGAVKTIGRRRYVRTYVVGQKSSSQ